MLLLLLLLLLLTLTYSNDIKSMFSYANNLYSKGLLSEAKEKYKEILIHEPNHSDANCNLGSVYLDLGDIKNAETFYRKALINRDHSGALFNLASLLQDRNNLLQNKDEINEARELYKRLLLLEPNSIDALSNLGSLEHLSGNYIAAISSYNKSIDIILKSDDNNNNNDELLSSLYEHYGRAVLRIAETEKILINSCTTTNTTTTTTTTNNNNNNKVDNLMNEAQNLLNSSLHYNSKNSVAKHMLMSILADKNNCNNNNNDDENYQASDDYITKLFDDFSISFESSLEKLEYHAPSLLVKAIKELNQSTYSLLLDIGCGTGLAAVLIKECNDFNIMYSTGVDLSPKMLSIAALKKVKEKKVYDSLYSGAMTTFIDYLALFRNNDDNINYKVIDNSKDVIDVEDGFDKNFINRKLLQKYPILGIAADVFVYVGDLDNVFTSLSKLKIDNHDIFAFTTEILSEDNTNKGFKLQQNGRYSHKKSYLDNLIKKYNFSTVTYKPVVLRKELNNDVHGHLYIIK